MKKTIMKLASVSLCVVLASGGVGMTSYALSGDKNGNNTILAENSVQDGAVNTENALVKNETVYVIAGAQGDVKKIIVSDWIKNSLRSSSINDKSSLTQVENVKGDESYTMSGDNMRVWNAAGNDIYYKGNIEKELPVNMSVTYTLDQKKVSFEELAGKSGKVTIRFDYENKQYQTVLIDGKEEKIYVPFVMLTGMILDNDVFTNVSVSNGKLINDGDKTIVAGIAFPGLQDSLAISEEKLEIPDYVEISADVKNFSMKSTVTIATNEVFNKIDTESLDSVDELTEAVDQMSGAMNELMNGSSKLYEGISTLLDKSGELIAGIDKLAAGAEQLKSGAGQVNDGAGQLNTAAGQVNAGAEELSTAAWQVNSGAGSVAEGASQLQNGAAALSEGLNTISANNDTLNGGARQVFETLLSTAQGQLAASGLTVPQLTIDNYAQTLDGVIAMLNAQGAGEAVKTVTALKASLDSYNSFYRGLETYTAKVAEASAGAAQLNTGASQLNAGAAQLSEGTAQLSAGAAQLSAGTAQLSAGTLSLKDGASQLYAGADELCSGILALKNGAPALTDGIKQLQSGSMQLSDGLKEFNEKGIKKLADYVNEDMDGLVTRVKAIGDVSKSYRSFSGISEDMDGEVKFIYRTDSVKSDK